MTQILVFHHCQGLTKGVESFADALRGAGHTVTTPDLYDGRVFATLEEGLGYLDAVGFDVVVERGVRAADALPSDLVYVGFSLGVMPAEKLAVTRPGALGAVFVHSCAPASAFGEAWPGSVPLQIHGMDRDPIFVDEGDLDAAREIVASAPRAELFLYPGEEHLFADSSLVSYDEAAAILLQSRVLEFVARVG